MNNTVDSVHQVNSMVGEMKGTEMERSQVPGQNDQALVPLDNVTQQNAALLEELTAAAGSSKTQSSGMNDAVCIFRC